MVERVDGRRAFQATTTDRLLVRFAERMALGTPYPKVVERVRQIVQSDELAGNCALAVDATGVGAPVVDMLRAARLGCELTAITITGGEQGTRSWMATNGSVPKRSGGRVAVAGAWGNENVGERRGAREDGRGRLRRGTTIWRSRWRWLAGARKGEFRMERVREDYLESELSKLSVEERPAARGRRGASFSEKAEAGRDTTALRITMRC